MARRSNKKAQGRSRRDRMRDRMKKRQERMASSSGGSAKFQFGKDVEFFEPKKGVMRINIIPYVVTVDNHPDAEKGETWYTREIFVHYDIGIDNASVICPKTIGKRCPICEYRDKLIKESWDDNEEEIKQLRASRREIYNIVNVDEDPNEILFWEVAYANFGEELGEEIKYADEDDLIFGLPELEDRPILKVRFSTKKFGKNEFLRATKISVEEGGDVDEDLVSEAVDLDRCMVIMKYDDLQKVFLQIEEPDEEPAQTEDDDTRSAPDPDGEEEEGPRSRNTRGRGKRCASAKESDPDGEEDTGEDEDGRKTSSRRRRRAKAGKTESPCPFGHVFGQDCDEHDDCDDCDKWDDCMDKKEELEEGNAPF